MGIAFGKVQSEMPAHVVLRRASGYEIWRYPSSVAAVVYASDLSKDGSSPLTDRAFRNAAFGMLARYIGVFSTPENAKGTTGETEPEKIAMTAPVVMTAPEKIAMTAPVVMAATAAAAGESMKFLLPAKYSAIEDAPVPTNPAVKLEMETAGRVEAVLTFSGDLDMTVSAERAEELRKLLERDDLAPVGHWTAHGYNPPFTLPMLKRNEFQE